MGGSNVKDLPVGIEMAGKVDKQEGHFFRVSITDRIVESGFVMTCRSIAKSKFKLILFDKDGSVRCVQESETRAKHTSADMFLTKLELMDTDDTFKCLSDQEQTLPDIFHRLKTLERIQTPALEAGTHLFCVYGDNWFSSLQYIVQCLPIEPDAVESIQHVEQDLLRTKLELEAYQAEFTAAQKAYEAAMVKADGLDKRTKGLLTTRRAAYDDFFNVAALPYKELNRKAGAQEPEATSTFASLWNRFSSVAELLALFHEAVSRRATESTQANTVSSRSHLIVFLKLVGAGPPSDGGQMVLLDLAGSERKEDQFTNDKQRQQETIETNMSHLALKQCLLAKENNSHVPYRNSALTRILKNSLWAAHKSCQAAVVVTASPIPADTEHTMCSLLNARRMVEVNPTVVQTVFEITETSEAKPIKLFKSFSHADVQKWLGAVSHVGKTCDRSSSHPTVTKKPSNFWTYVLAVDLRTGKLLDIGAGDGNVTAKLATFFDTVYSTEVSMPMVRALNAKGFKYDRKVPHPTPSSD
ncbi:hypothetical protein DYB32_007099 [Aphanomyces invadans]|uniref:Kinesin motor domain-containing protein n=1 Tax=Aphanomyces invadans TaxID=157072 RepID=A0A418APF3_9STRA|nr:hypothetical protein DYB32_007099 [Aphanomyces invadans]